GAAIGEHDQCWWDGGACGDHYDRRLADLQGCSWSLPDARRSGQGRTRVEARVLGLRGLPLNARVSGGRPVACEDAGRQIASLLGGYSAVVVTSSDPFAAAYVALGIAKAESKHRRSVVADLVGDLPPLRDLVAEEDPHGITDSFLYGVSLNKIGYGVAGAENLYVMPSGTDPDIGEEIFRSARRKKLPRG